MNERDETDRLEQGISEAPLSHHLDRGTLAGCFGILLVLSLPALLFLPLERWHLPLWLGRLLPLFVVCAVVLGVWLLFQVPSSRAPARSYDPRYPLTRGGRLPLEERPASMRNRLVLLLGLVLVACAVTSYLLVSFTTTERGFAIGTLLAGIAGGGLLIGGALAALHRIPVPAWRWVRTPIQGGPAFQALPLALIGLVTLAWSLFAAVAAGYAWAPPAIGLLILAGVLAGPVLQRLPDRRRR
jgi:hypothetical protein